MFCFQCEQTAKGEGCTKIGVCGKQPETAVLQDLLIHAVKGLSQVAVEARKAGISDDAVNRFTCEAVFSTLTNVDFDDERFVKLIRACVDHREALKKKLAAAGGGTVSFTSDAATFTPAGTTAGMTAQGEKVGIKADPDMNPDLLSLRELLIYGIKGLAAYADHAAILGQTGRVCICLHP